MNGHTTFRLRRRLFVTLKTGEQFVDKLLEYHDRYYRFEARGRIERKLIRFMGYARVNPTDDSPESSPTKEPAR